MRSHSLTKIVLLVFAPSAMTLASCPIGDPLCNAYKALIQIASPDRPAPPAGLSAAQSLQYSDTLPESYAPAQPQSVDEIANAGDRASLLKDAERRSRMIVAEITASNELLSPWTTGTVGGENLCSSSLLSATNQPVLQELCALTSKAAAMASSFTSAADNDNGGWKILKAGAHSHTTTTGQNGFNDDTNAGALPGTTLTPAAATALNTVGATVGDSLGYDETGQKAAGSAGTNASSGSTNAGASSSSTGPNIQLSAAAQQVLTDRGIDPQTVVDALNSGQITSGEDLRKATGDTTAYTPAEIAEAQEAAKAQLASLLEEARGNDPARATQAGILADGNGKAAGSSSSAAKNAKSVLAALQSRGLLLRMAGSNGLRAAGTAATKIVTSNGPVPHSRDYYQSLGIYSGKPAQSIFQIAHRNYRGYQRWQKEASHGRVAALY